MIDERVRDLERQSRIDPSILDRAELLSMMECDIWSVRMHLCRMFPRLEWPPEEYREIRDFVLRQAADKNTFVRAWALDALACFACFDESIRPRVLEMIERALSTEPPSVRVRAREGLKRIMG